MRQTVQKRAGSKNSQAVLPHASGRAKLQGHVRGAKSKKAEVGRSTETITDGEV